MLNDELCQAHYISIFSIETSFGISLVHISVSSVSKHYETSVLRRDNGMESFPRM